MQLTDFHFELPSDLIAQRPAPVRSQARLLAVDGASGVLADRAIGELPALLAPGDLLVFNDTRVIPARAFGVKDSGGRVELLLERVESRCVALLHARSGNRLRAGARIGLAGGHSARMLERADELFRLEFSTGVLEFFEAHGEMPLPPYIGRAAEPDDRERYQTVFARVDGAVAAPTAGLHFDAALFAALEARGIGRAFVTLHVGAGTFQPLRGDIESHRMHAEHATVGAAACEAVRAARARGGRVVAVGTTVVRSLETAASGGALRPFEGQTRMFIRPGHRFRAVDAMVTNFHLPGSTLLLLCAAFVGRETLLGAYAHAVRERYRFFSYGDATLLTPAAGVLERP